MAEHTPGPWQVVRAEHTQLITATVSRGDVLVAEVRPVWDSGEANARLIAAAPELLAALKQLTAAAEKEDWDGHADAGSDPDLDVARAAIARAEGRQP